MMSYLTIIFILNVVQSILAVPRCPALALDFHAMGIDCDPVIINHVPLDEESAKKVDEATMCEGYGHFKVDKDLGCSSPTLPPGLEMEYPCDCKFGGHCTVFCSDGYKLEGPNVITCLPNGLWSELPGCVAETCNRPSSSMTFDGVCSMREGQSCNFTCISDGYRISPSRNLKCLNSVWTPTPRCVKFCKMEDIPPYLETDLGTFEDDSKCTGRDNHYCTFRCKNNMKMFGRRSVMCAGNEWRNFPYCGCDRSKLPQTVVLVSGACIPKPGTSCDAKCIDHYEPENYHLTKVICDSEGKWDQKSIKCVKVCHTPISLPPSVKLVGPCTGRQRDICKVKCVEKHKTLIGGEDIKCLPTGEYSTLPFCTEDKKCSSKSFSKEIEFKPGCRFLIGETCEVKCVDGKASLAGSSSITCRSTQTWSEIPRCVYSCVKPNFDPNLEFGDCKLREGDTCNVRCKSGYAATVKLLPGEWKTFTCLHSGLWDLPFFSCKEVCPEPLLDDETISISSCDQTKIGGFCRLTCIHSESVLKPKKTITCLQSKTWDDIPRCYRKCKPPVLPPYLELLPGCSFLEVDKPCKLKCVDSKAELLGQSNIACFPDGMYLQEKTVCGIPCKSPILPSHIKVITCTDLGKQHSRCSIECSDPHKYLIGMDSIKCWDGNWDIKATCETSCPAPFLQPNTTIEGECLFLTNFPCHVKCVHPEYRLNGEASQIITCQDGSWNWTAECERVCPDPLTSIVMAEEMILESECPRKRGSRCQLKCMDDRMGSNPYITCGNDFKWHPKHVHCDIACDRPEELPYLAIDDSRPCTFHALEKCYVKCLGDRVLHGEPFIYCQESGTWSTIPTCELACTNPPSHFSILNATACSKEFDTECIMVCGNKKSQNFTNYCSYKGRWDKPWPDEEFCGLSHQVEVTSEKSECTPPPDMVMTDCPGKYWMCYFKCINDSLHVIGGEARGFCDQNYNMFVERTCGILYDVPCNPYNLPSDLRLKNKGPYRMIEYHDVECKSGLVFKRRERHAVACEPGGEWGDFPKCVLPCPKEDLEKFGMTVRTDHLGECWNQAGSYCPIECLKKDEEPGEEIALYCNEDGTWARPIRGCVPKSHFEGFTKRCGPLPFHLMSMPDLGDEEKDTQPVTCAGEEMVLVGPDIVKCLKSKKYTRLPECQLRDHFDRGTRMRGRQCKANLNFHGEFYEDSDDCHGLISPVGSLCHVHNHEQCLEETPSLCMKNLEWSKPICGDIKYYPTKD